MKKIKEDLFTDKNVKQTVNVACAIIMRTENGVNSVLMIKRAKNDHWPNHWELPRGKCDKPPGEDLKHCVVREAKEETGLDIIPGDMIDTYIYYAMGGTRKTTCYNFLCRMKNQNQEVKLSKEHQDYKWISEVGVAELLIHPDQKKALIKVLNPEREIVSYPDNNFSDSNKIEEYLRIIQGGVKRGR
jgi:mutator protein MutT